MREYIIALIGKILVQNPEATNREILKFLERNGFNGLTENTVGKYTKKANAFRIVRVRRQTVELANVEYAGHLREALMGAWNIARDTGTNPLIKLAAYNTIGKLAKQLRDMFLEAKSLEKSPESSAIPSDAAVNLRALAPLPPDLREQRDRWLQTHGILEESQLSGSATEIDETVVAELAEERKIEEEEKKQEEEAASREEEEKRKREEAINYVDQAAIQRGCRTSWPSAAHSYSMEERIREYRRTFGQGEAAKDWDESWEHNKGKGPCPI